MRATMACWAALLALLAATSVHGAAPAPAAAPAAAEPLGCTFMSIAQAEDLPDLQTWEFDLQLPANKLAASQAELVAQASADLQGLGLEPDATQAETKAQTWTTYFLLDAEAEGESALGSGAGSLTPFDSPGTLRFRKSIGEPKKKANRRLLKKEDTWADLRLKARIDPSTFSVDEFQQQIGWNDKVNGAKAKVETFGQQKCIGRKEFVGVRFKGVSPDLNVSTPAGVRQYFPGLAKHFNLSEDAPLKLDDDVYRSSTSWPCPTDAGVEVTCGIQINYPTAEAALAGTDGTVGQFGFSVDTEGLSKGQLKATLKTLAAAADEMTRKGWEAGPENDI